MANEYTEIKGSRHTPEITLYSLSYCGACTSAKKYLSEQGLSFRYITVDLLHRDRIREIRKHLQGEDNRKVLYPVLEINGNEKLFGFVKVLWERKLNTTVPV